MGGVATLAGSGYCSCQPKSPFFSVLCRCLTQTWNERENQQDEGIKRMSHFHHKIFAQTTIGVSFQHPVKHPQRKNSTRLPAKEGTFTLAKTNKDCKPQGREHPEGPRELYKIKEAGECPELRFARP